MTLVQTQVDVEAAVGGIIRAANVTNLAQRVYSSIPSKNPSYPLATVKRIGGIPIIRERVDRARIQVDVWGDTKGNAFDVTADVRAVLFDAEGKTYSDSNVTLFIAAVEDDLGIAFLPDPNTARDRYVFGVAIICHGVV